MAEARCLTAISRNSIQEWLGNKAWFYDSNGESELYVETPDRTICATEGQFILKWPNGALNVLAEDEFWSKFEPCE